VTEPWVSVCAALHSSRAESIRNACDDMDDRPSRTRKYDHGESQGRDQKGVSGGDTVRATAKNTVAPQQRPYNFVAMFVRFGTSLVRHCWYAVIDVM